ncbi:MAG: sensor histidine kinase [Bacillota bacterium]|nr:sensor histidine kinase [Bacillota bacterium]
MSGSTPLSKSNGLYVVYVSMFLFTVYLTLDFIMKRNYYGKLKEASNAQRLDWVNSLPEPMNAEQRTCQELMQKLYQNANEELSEYHLKSAEDLEFVTTWVHEIKTPIAASKLIIENSLNNPSEKALFSIEDEINKIEDFVQMTLFYSRARDFAKDYIISSISLENVIKNCIKTEYPNITNKNLKIRIDNLNLEVDTDEKWLGFIFKQLLDNAVKYSPLGGEIKIYASRTEKECTLIIEDSGVGIKQEDIGRIFEKNFTGANGRKYNTSTGIGLYLSQKLARKLGHFISAESDYGHSTKVTVHFPKWNDFFDLGCN